MAMKFQSPQVLQISVGLLLPMQGIGGALWLNRLFFILHVDFNKWSRNCWQFLSRTPFEDGSFETFQQPRVPSVVVRCAWEEAYFVGSRLEPVWENHIYLIDRCLVFSLGPGSRQFEGAGNTKCNWYNSLMMTMLPLLFACAFQELTSRSSFFFQSQSEYDSQRRKKCILTFICEEVPCQSLESRFLRRE